MKRHIVLMMLAMFVTATDCHAYDDDVSHRDLTKSAVINSTLNMFFAEYLGYPDGYETTYHIQIPTFEDNDERNGSKGWQLTEIIQEGARMEDSPDCRASNHFHNPVKAWAEAGLTDKFNLRA